MKLCASNIGWPSECDDTVYGLMRDYGFSGLEIAPSRIFPQNPYEHLREASEFAAKMKADYGLSIASMQSIWYGMTQRIAGTSQDRNELLEYTRKAVRFADAVSCRNIVFGCPKNRNMLHPDDEAVIVQFLLDVANEAGKFGVVIALEPNPEIYGTNFVNTTSQALGLVSRLNHPSLKINLDFGTVIANSETLSSIHENISFISHVHISEPELMPIKPRKEHEELSGILKAAGYDKYISIEMRKTDTETLKQVMTYLREVFA